MKNQTSIRKRYLLFYLLSFSFSLSAQWSLLPDLNSVSAVTVHGPDIWAGVAGGLVRMNLIDSTRTIFDRLTPGFEDFAVSHLVVDHTGTVWMGDNFRGMARLREGEITAIPTFSFQSNRFQVRGIALSADSTTVWYATDQGLLRIIDDNWQVWDTSNSNLPTNDLRAVTVDLDNQVWLGSANGLIAFSETEVTVYNTDNSPLEANLINTVFVDPDNVLWVGMADVFNDPLNTGGLARFSNGEWTIYSSDNVPLLDNDNVRGIEYLPGGSLLVALTRNTLSSIGSSFRILRSDNTWGVYSGDSEYSLSLRQSGMVYSTFYQRLFFASVGIVGQGLDNLVNYPIAPSGPVSAPTKLLFQGEDLLACVSLSNFEANDNGQQLTRLQNDSWVTYDESRCETFIISPVDSLITFNRPLQISRLVVDSFVTVPVDTVLPVFSLAAFQAQPNGRILLGGRGLSGARFLLFSIHPQTGNTIDLSVNYPFGDMDERLRGATIDADGNVVAASSISGVGYFINRLLPSGQWEPIDLSSSQMTSISEMMTSPSGQIWIRNSQFFSRLTNEGWLDYPLQIGEVSYDRTFTFDSSGELWVIDEGTLYRTEEDQLVMVTEFPFSFLRFDAMAFAPDGKLWFGPREGMLIYDPNFIINSAADPDQPLDATSVLLFPNPAHDWVRLQLPGEISADEATTCYLFDVMGRLQRSNVFMGEQTKIDLHHLPSGRYFIRVQSTSKAYRTTSFIKH